MALPQTPNQPISRPAPNQPAPNQPAPNQPTPSPQPVPRPAPSWATLETLLEPTMMFTGSVGAPRRVRRAPRALAASPPAPTPDFTRYGPGAEIEVPRPSDGADDALTVPMIHSRAIWHFEHEAASPATFRNVSCLSRLVEACGTRMPVLTDVTFGRVRVKINGVDHRLPLTREHVVRKYLLKQGYIPDSDRGLWRLEAELDVSLMVVFAYRVTGVGLALVRDVDVAARAVIAAGLASGARAAAPATTTTVPLFGQVVFVAVSLTTCKERADYEPAGLIGMARLYPHVMVVSNAVLEETEFSVRLTRPTESSHIHQDMLLPMKPLLVTDTNIPHSLPNRIVNAISDEVLDPVLGLNPVAPPLPLWDNFFDYYEIDPAERRFDVQEARVVNRHARARDIENAIQKPNYRLMRESSNITESCSTSDFYRPPEKIHKVARQGAFDNVHIAPRMRVFYKQEFHEVVMAPFCEHDCFHMHFRWGQIAGDVRPKWTKGFGPRGPYTVDFATLVPMNQDVYIKFPTPNALDYRATATRTEPGKWVCFFHHGASYAIDAMNEEAAGLLQGARDAVQAFALMTDEPFQVVTLVPHAPFVRRGPGLDAGDSWAAFYWRLRYSGRKAPFNPDHDCIVERIKIVDWDACIS
jgi:hypothetical protein